MFRGDDVVATDVYGDALWPELRATVIPANSFRVATAPLDAAVLAQILPGRRVVSDGRRIANYFRIGLGGRLMMGGRGSFAEPRSLADYHRIVAALPSFFPQTKPTPLEIRWAGRVAMTRDSLPHIHRPFANLTIAPGYNRRGVALASSHGGAIGARRLDRASPLPLKLTDIKPTPIHGLHPFCASAMIWAYRLSDALER